MAAASPSNPTNYVDLQVKTLQEYEDGLVQALTLKNSVEVSKKMFQRCVISDVMMDMFASLDHSRVDPQLQIKYLLKLVRVKIREDESVWEKFLSVLIGIGMKEISECLRQNIVPVGTVHNKRENVNIPLKIEDIPLLLELLVQISHKWELLGTALGLPSCDVENFRRNDNGISLKLVISCWISRDTKTPPVSTLKSSVTVGEGRVALDIEHRYRESKKMEHCSYTMELGSSKTLLTILNQSYDTEVADGKSTLLLVQGSPRESVSYQWKKDGQPLSKNSSYYYGVDDDTLFINARQGAEGEYTCCVSNQGKEVRSNKITLTVLFSLAKKRLLNLYSVHRDVPSDSWPPVGVRTFINLVLIKPNMNKSKPSDYCISGDADKLAVMKKKVEYKQVFGKYRNRELILVEGRPGSGKTTLVHKLIKDWTKGNILLKAKLVFLITLRILGKNREESLSTILRQFYLNDDDLKNVTTDIERGDGEGVCFILDGLDEYQPQNEHTSIIYKLLDKTYLPQAMIIVSSRPAAAEILNIEH